MFDVIFHMYCDVLLFVGLMYNSIFERLFLLHDCSLRFIDWGFVGRFWVTILFHYWVFELDLGSLEATWRVLWSAKSVSVQQLTQMEDCV